MFGTTPPGYPGAPICLDADGVGASSGIRALPYRTAQLPNGLKLIVHEDRRRPLIASYLVFNVGSKDEPAGRTGFAHLFEHLMFKASANRAGSWHQAVDALGATGVNGSTSCDRTDFYQTIPSGALDTLLWMESDRMGQLLAALDSDTLSQEIGVVKNEKRQRENAPFGGLYEAVAMTLYPRDHPYGHTVLGSFEDLDAATLETAADWYRRWYGASNAILTLAGDISLDEAIDKVGHWFADVPAGITPPQLQTWTPAAGGERRLRLVDRIPHRFLGLLWQTPGARSPDALPLQILASVLAGGSHSRLYRRLVDEERLCLSISAHQDARMLCGEFLISATLADGADAELVEALIDDEITRFLEQGPSEQELARRRHLEKVGFAQGCESLGNIAMQMGMGMLFHDRPDIYRQNFETLTSITPEELKIVGARWLGQRSLAIDVLPRLDARPVSVPRTVAPAPQRSAASLLPPVSRLHLSNGMEIIAAHRPGAELVSMGLWLDRGVVEDFLGQEGLTGSVMGALTSGVIGRTRNEISEVLADQAIDFAVSALPFSCLLRMSMLPEAAPTAMQLLSDLWLRPTFPDAEIATLRDRQRARIHAARLSPGAVAGHVSNRGAFGRTHWKARHLGGTPDSIASLTSDLLRKRHHGLLRAARPVLLVVGDVDLKRFADMADKCFGALPLYGLGEPVPVDHEIRPETGAFGVAFRGSDQSCLSIRMQTPLAALERADVKIADYIFGGHFSSRINANLREKRGWTYGAGSRLSMAPAAGSFCIETAVEGVHTQEALAEIRLELEMLCGSCPITSEEFTAARDTAFNTLAHRWTSNGSVLGALAANLDFGLPDGFDDAEEERLSTLTLDQVRAAAAELGQADRFSWVAAGDPRFLVGMKSVDADGEASDD